MKVTERHTTPISELSQAALQEMQRRYDVRAAEMQPKVYYRLTDNWLKLTVRFIAKDHGIRTLKDPMSRDILKALDDAGIGMAEDSDEDERVFRREREWHSGLKANSDRSVATLALAIRLRQGKRSEAKRRTDGC
jgi:hypothetical protein